MTFTVRLGALAVVDVRACDPQRAAIMAAERAGMRADTLAIVTDETGEATRWTVRYVETRYARPA